MLLFIVNSIFQLNLNLFDTINIQKRHRKALVTALRVEQVGVGAAGGGHLTGKHGQPRLSLRRVAKSLLLRNHRCQVLAGPV